MEKNQGRAWCFTLNDYTEDEAGLAMDWMEEQAGYAVFGWEIAENTFMPHIQGYFRMSRNRNLRYFYCRGLIPTFKLSSLNNSPAAKRRRPRHTAVTCLSEARPQYPSHSLLVIAATTLT